MHGGSLELTFTVLLILPDIRLRAKATLIYSYVRSDQLRIVGDVKKESWQDKPISRSQDSTGCTG